MTTTQELLTTTQFRIALRDRFILVQFPATDTLESPVWKRVPIPKDLILLQCQLVGVSCFQLLIGKMVHFYESVSGGELYRGLFKDRVQVVRELTQALSEAQDFAEQRKNLVDTSQGCEQGNAADWDTYLKG